MTTPPLSPTVLVVDDEPSIVEALGKVLAKEGLSILTASHGREALDVIRRQPVHVIITDLRMPSMGGEDLLKAVKAITPEVEVIVMTAYGTIENAVEAIRDLLGPTDSTKAPPGTIRGDLGITSMKNICHASDSVENATIEVERFFDAGEAH